ncbi:class 1b ribonucleoside-diphosphate reductase subunit beta [Bacillus tropicus]|uniref:class 1b ribonucleoside-diphosphate reductase subunit beta n=1 Tax=Bacillus tropicus TaxID=2026188 RepID=UPI001123C810|nr:class 1b ribonucleoside-diphosphate reductase subunit beta [Bacillus tropicus]TNP18973.1 class 1b ribonucleoside-diphosphate reductase subunit beta [Bacillus tropicus]
MISTISVDLKKHKAVNWTKYNTEYIESIYNQMRQQFWLENEIPVSKDKNVWDMLPKEQKEVYKKVLGGLTLLDTKQGGEGMPLVSLHMEDPQKKAIINFMAMMEDIHAKSYSHIFMTLCENEEVDAVFDWVEENPFLQKKADIITGHYRKLLKPDVDPKELYMAIVASVFLESFLFYSGFFYPLFLAGQGQLTASGEIIALILRDEAIHGVTGGIFAQEIYENQLTEAEQQEVDKEAIQLLEVLYANELDYTNDVYAPLGQDMIEEVNKFLRYNANKAMMNLGYDQYFDDEYVNPIVQNGLQTKTKQHDFFSVKGNGYVKAINVEEVRDEDFVFEGLPSYAA